MKKKLYAIIFMILSVNMLWATDGYVKVTSSNNTISWVKIKLEYKYNGNEYKVSSYAIDKNTEGAVDLDNVWSESGGTGKQYVIIELDYNAFYSCSKITSVICTSTSFTTIYNAAFAYCNSLKSVNIPFVQEIQSQAFWHCSSLTSTKFEGIWPVGGKTMSMLYKIDSNAFGYCTSLTSFTIPSDVRILEGNAFQGCTSLTNLTISSNNTYFTIENGVIYSKDLKTLQVYLPSKAETIFATPETVTKIGSYAFSGNRNLSKVILRKGVQTIDTYAFYNASVQSVFLPSSITAIGNYAFQYCKQLVSVKTASSEPISISNNIFSNAGNATLYVPQGSKEAYQNAENWKTFSQIEEYPTPSIINFADATVKKICVSNWDFNGDGELDEDEAKDVIELGTQFSGNTEITSFDELQYFTNLKHITASAFSGCTNLASIKVPASLTKIGQNAFQNTAWLNAQSDGLVYIGNVLYTYKGTMPANTKIVVKDGTTCICNYAFSNQTNLIEIELPNSLLYLGTEDTSFSEYGYVFNYCTGLTTIKIPAGVKDIVRYTFRGSGLKTIELPEALESIGNSSFRSCTSLESIVIPNRVTKIGKNTFRSCSRLKTVTMPYYLQTVATDAFRDCSQLQAVHISNIGGWCNVDFEDYRANPLTYAHRLYQNEKEIVELDIPSNDYIGSGYDYYGQWSGHWSYEMKTIKPLVFYGCTSIKKLFIHNNITSIGNGAFTSCTSLSSVKVETTPFELNSNAFPTRSNITLYTPINYVDQYQSANVWNTFKTIKGYPDRDVNCDNNIDVVDVVDIVRYTMDNPSDAFDLFIADLDNNQTIDLKDAQQELSSVAYSTTLTTILPESSEQTNVVKLGNFETRARKTCSTSILLENSSDKLVGFQMDITLPEGLSLSSNLCRLSNRITDKEQQLIIASLGNNTYRFTSVSLSLQPINGKDGEIITLSLDATNLTASGNITVSNIRFVTDNSERIVMPIAEYEVQPVEYLQFLSGDGTEDNPYLIFYPNDFINLANDVNNGTSYGGTYFKVGKPEIDFSGVSYTAIGTESKQFGGYFDGNGVVIKNLSATNGLFGYMSKNGTITNIIIDETCIINGTSRDAAGFVGASRGTISNCINKASVTSTKYHIGGICGDNMGTIINCKNYGDISSNHDVGMVGGIAGDIDSGKILNCENYGKVTGPACWIGGIVGLVTGNKSVIDGCLNAGDVSGTNDIGGITGSYDQTVSVTNNLVTSCTITGTNTSSPIGAGAISPGLNRTSANNYYTKDVIVKVGTNTYDNDTPRGIWGDSGPVDVENNNGAVMVEAFATGDADGDGVVDVNDVTSTINYILGKPVNKFVLKAADVDGDDTIDVNDVQGIIDIALGK